LHICNQKGAFTVCVAHAHAGRTHTVGDHRAFFADARSDAQKARRTPTVFRYSAIKNQIINNKSK